MQRERERESKRYLLSQAGGSRCPNQLNFNGHPEWIHTFAGFLIHSYPKDNVLSPSPFIALAHCCCCYCFWLRQLSIVHHVTIFCCDKWQHNQIANGRLTVCTDSTTLITLRLAASVGLTEPYWYAAHGVHMGTRIKTRINRRLISCVPCTAKPLSAWLQQ